MTQRLGRVAPGLSALLHYRIAENFQYDFVAGLSVAAVGLPVAVAYAELAGFSPVVGLYSSILPLVAYAVFGTSRQLIVNPDAATCAMIAAAVAPDASGNADLYLSLSITLTFFTGLICIVASFFRLGAFADFLSKPILVGFLNGIAISIFLGQVGKLLGFSINSSGVIPRLFEIFAKLSCAYACSGAGQLFLSVRFLPRIPAALLVLAIAGACLRAFSARGSRRRSVGTRPRWVTPIALADIAARRAANDGGRCGRSRTGDCEKIEAREEIPHVSSKHFRAGRTSGRPQLRCWKPSPASLRREEFPHVLLASIYRIEVSS